MITATPPAYYEQLVVNEPQRRPRGASDDSVRIDECSINALKHLMSTPRHTMAPLEDLDDYNAPGLKRMGAKRVRLNYRGAMLPIPLDQDFEQ